MNAVAMLTLLIQMGVCKPMTMTVHNDEIVMVICPLLKQPESEPEDESGSGD